MFWSAIFIWQCMAVSKVSYLHFLTLSHAVPRIFQATPPHMKIVCSRTILFNAVIKLKSCLNTEYIPHTVNENQSNPALKSIN